MGKILGVELNLSFSTESWFHLFAIIFVLSVVPIKLGAKLVKASRSGWLACTAAALIGMVTTAISLFLFSGLPAILVALCLIILVYWLVLKCSVNAAVGLSIAVFILQIGVMQVLIKAGVILSS